MPFDVTTMIQAVWRVFLQASPYVLFGLIAATFIYAFFPKDRIHSLFGGRSAGSVTRGALVGIPLPLCSCAVVPTALSLRDRGAGRGSTVAFLISTPETGVDSIALTAGMLGPVMAVLRPVMAFITALAAGFSVNAIREVDQAGTVGEQHKGNCPDCGEAPHAHDDVCRTSFKKKLSLGVNYIYRDFFPDIATWLFIGLVISGVLTVLLPTDFFLFASDKVQYLLALLAGVPLYVCASASTPIAAVLIAKGLSPGAALIFLLVGPATNAASLAVVARRLGLRTTTVYLGVILIVSLVAGFATDMLLSTTSWSVTSALHPEHVEHAGPIAVLSAIVLVLMTLQVWMRTLFRRFARSKAVGFEPNATDK